jgi:hypothetical protein
MSTCPRYTGNFKEGRSLSMHLSRFCSGPTLLCNTLTGLLSSKRSMEQMRSESSRTTFQQQIRMFDLLTNDLSFPIRNPLHSIPSLVHLSSTQSELESSNVNYAGFDIDFSAPDSADDQMNVSNDGPEGRSLYCLNLNCRAPPGRFFRSDLTGLVAGCLC